jgi:hypothetical protein
MDYKRLLITSIVIFVFALVWNGVVHLVILRDSNAALATLARTGAEKRMSLSLLVTAALAMLFVWSFARYAREGGLRDGLTHGLFFGLLAGVLVDLNQYVLYPIPGSLAAKWFAFGLLEFCIYGILASWLYPVERRTAP